MFAIGSSHINLELSDVVTTPADITMIEANRPKDCLNNITVVCYFLPTHNRYLMIIINNVVAN